MSGAIYDGTKNYTLHFGDDYRNAQERASGRVKGTEAGRERYNGGLSSPLETRLQRGDALYRFSGSAAMSVDKRASGEWWFDRETLLFLMSRGGGTDAGFRQVARTAFAVIDEWSDMNFCVSGILAHDVWAIGGNTAAASGRGGTLHNPYGLSVRQLFVPGGLKPSDFSLVRPVMLTRVAY